MLFYDIFFLSVTQVYMKEHRGHELVFALKPSIFRSLLGNRYLEPLKLPCDTFLKEVW